MTRTFEQENYVKFQTEIMQSDGLDEQAKAYRVIPVWAEFEKNKCQILSLKHLTGFSYVSYIKNEPLLKKAYFKLVANQIIQGRREFP